MRMIRRVGLLLTLCLIFASHAGAGDDTLVVAMKVSFDSLCQTRSSSRQALILSHHWADTLVYRGPRLKSPGSSRRPTKRNPRKNEETSCRRPSS